MIEIMKVAAMDAIENSKPCDLRFGTVISTTPLKIQITNNLILPESLLIVPQNLTDYTVDANMGIGRNDGYSITVTNETLNLTSNTESEDIETDPTEGTVDSKPAEEVNERTITVYNALQIGDKVALIRNQGSTKFYILDRI